MEEVLRRRLDVSRKLRDKGVFAHFLKDIVVLELPL
jgi:hypothetical protein